MGYPSYHLFFRTFPYHHEISATIFTANPGHARYTTIDGPFRNRLIGGTYHIAYLLGLNFNIPQFLEKDGTVAPFRILEFPLIKCLSWLTGFIHVYIWGVPPKIRVSRVPKQMVYIGQSHLEMDDGWGYPYDLGNLHMFIPLFTQLSTIRCRISHLGAPR